MMNILAYTYLRAVYVAFIMFQLEVCIIMLKHQHHCKEFNEF